VGSATWAEFEADAPELARKGRALLYQHGAPLGFLGTVRPDGGPRLHPVCPVVAEDGLWVYVLRHSPKAADLRRDRRFALHAFLPEQVDDEFFIRGRAEPLDPEPALHEALVAAAKPASIGSPEEQLFQLRLERVLIATYAYRGQWPPVYEKWAAGQAPAEAGAERS